MTNLGSSISFFYLIFTSAKPYSFGVLGKVTWQENFPDFEALQNIIQEKRDTVLKEVIIPKEKTKELNFRMNKWNKQVSLLKNRLTNDYGINTVNDKTDVPFSPKVASNFSCSFSILCKESDHGYSIISSIEPLTRKL